MSSKNKEIKREKWGSGDIIRTIVYGQSEEAAGKKIFA
jgi:hypothetical protein